MSIWLTLILVLYFSCSTYLTCACYLAMEDIFEPEFKRWQKISICVFAWFFGPILLFLLWLIHFVFDPEENYKDKTIGTES